LSHIRLLRSQMRRGWGDEELALQRRGFQRRLPSLSWIEDGAALIRVPSFESGYDRDEVSYLFDQAKDAKYLVVDLRQNPGGEVENMRHFLGLVMPSTDSIGTFVTRRLARDFGRVQPGTSSDPVAIAKWAHQEIHPARSGMAPFEGKIAVLIDNGSASASEIVANSLRENRHATLVGAPTMGAVLVSTFDRLSYGFQIQFPIGDYVSHEGRRLEGHPVTPDVAASGADAVATALAKLKG
jgi:carboxyl-terminal processing protease